MLALQSLQVYKRWIQRAHIVAGATSNIRKPFDARARLGKYSRLFIMITQVKKDWSLMAYVEFPPTAFGPLSPPGVGAGGASARWTR